MHRTATRDGEAIGDAVADEKIGHVIGKSDFHKSVLSVDKSFGRFSKKKPLRGERAFLFSRLLIHSLDDGLCHIVKHLVGHSGVNAYPEGVGHDAVGLGERAYDAVALAGLSHFVEAGVLGQVTCKEHTGLNAHLLNIGHHLVAAHALAAGQKEAEPRGVRVLASLGENELVRDGSELFLEVCKIRVPFETEIAAGTPMNSLLTPSGALFSKITSLIS